MNSRGGKILVIRGGAIGDFILTLPAIAALRRGFPQAHLEVLGYPHIVQLATAAGLVDRASSIEARPLAGFFARNGQLAADLADYFSEFDLIVSYLYDPDEIFRTNVSRCSPAQFIAGPHRPDEGSQVHATKVYLKPLERLAIFEADYIPRLRLLQGPAMVEVPATLGEPLAKSDSLPNASRIALHPGSGSDRKNWPEYRWAELIQKIMDQTSINLLLVGGEAEGERLQRLAAALPPSRTSVAQSLPLSQLARLLSGCRGFIGHDSGISHLAAALDLAAVLIWGATKESIWRPPHDKVTLVRSAKGLEQITVGQVFEAARRLWSSE